MDELNRIARRCLNSERAAASVQTTLLVNEAYLRLVDVQRVRWQDRAHFLATAARLMRRVLVDLARARRARKRGGGVVRVTFDELTVRPSEPGSDVIALDDALIALAQIDERKSRVVDLRYFAGLSVEETATVLNVSVDTVMRDWKLARAWLMREIRRAPTDGAR